MLPFQNLWSICILVSNFLLTAHGVGYCDLNTTTDPNCTPLKLIHQSMDASVDPCVDFYGYTCNNWPHTHQSMADLLDDQMNRKLIAIMEDMSEERLHTDFFNKTYVYYQSCLGAKNDGDLRGYLDIIRPGTNLEWPILVNSGNVNATQWPAEGFDFLQLLAELLDNGINNLLLQFQLNVAPDSSVDILIMPSDAARLTEEEMLDVLQRIGVAANGIFYLTERILAIQRIVFNPSMEFYGHDEMDISDDELKSRYPQLQTLLENSTLISAGKLKKIHLKNFKYLDFFLNYQWNSREKEDLCNYMMILMLRQFQRDRKSLGHTRMDCMREVRNKLDLATNLLYYDYYRPEELQRNGDFQEMFRQLCMLLRHVDRRNPPKKWQKSHNCATLSLNVGNFPKSFRNSQLRALFSDIAELNRTNFYQNYLHLYRHKFLKSLEGGRLGYHIMDLNEYLTRPLFSEERNILAIPLGMVQPPMYHKGYDAIFKLSYLGFHLARHFWNTEYHGRRLIGGDNDFVATPIARECAKSVGAAILAYFTYAIFHAKQWPGNFTDTSWKQLFFLNLSQTFCMGSGANARLRRENGKILRVIAGKIPFFNEAFNCGEVEDNLNRLQKC